MDGGISLKELGLAFINSRWYLTHKLHTEILSEPQLLADFLHRHQLPPLPPAPEEALRRLLALRTFLAKALDGFLVDRTLAPETIAGLNGYLAGAPCLRQVAQQGNSVSLSLAPLKYDWDWFMAEVAASFVELVSRPETERIKQCGNPECGWFFFDETKSRTKRWCDDTCASLMKVRKFRAKRKADTGR